MKLLKLLIIGILCLCFPSLLFAQDFSNKGKDFWLCYPAHIDGNVSRMALYISSTVNTSGTVTLPGGSIPFTVTANQATVVAISPAIYNVINAQNEGISIGKAIHITALNPIVVYAHILNAARSGSSLILPTNTLGREYIAASYKSSTSNTAFQINSSPAGSQFSILAVENNTTVEITPTSTDVSNTRPANVPFTVVLNQGDVYQFRTTFNNDITGTKIRSLGSSSSSCKPLAVFSGSSWTSMDCINASGGDNLFQQLMPKSSLGKNYITAPFADRQYDIFRIIVDDPTTVVTLNGLNLPIGTLINNSYYQFNSSTPNTITTDKPVMVVQYMISQTCDTRNAPGCSVCAYPGDPEMIIINPIEQTINDVTVVSARNNLIPPNTNITKHYFTIIMKSVATASLRIDGNAPTGTFVPIGATGYSYLHEDVTASTASNASHRINADSGFIALAYGLGNVESYGYNAGTNVKDLYQFITIENEYATVDFPATCSGSPFYFKNIFPYEPNQITWQFGPILNALGVADIVNNSPVYDSTWFINGRQLFRYSIPSTTTISVAGTYKIKVIANNPTPDGCSGIQEIDYDLEVFDPPVATFNFSTDGCVSAPVSFTDITNTGGRAIIKWSWDFGDGGTSSIMNPSHTYSAQDGYNATLAVITDVGCISDTANNLVTLTNLPNAKFGITAPYCAGKSILFSDTSTVSGGSTLVKWFWDFGDGSPVITAGSNASQSHIYPNVGTYTATLKVETSTGCQSFLFTKQVIIKENPVSSFNLTGNICLPSGTANFVSNSTIGDGTQALFTYLWDFGDGNTSAAANPVHSYTGSGPFTIKLTTTSNNGCVDDTIRIINNVFTQPLADFNVQPEVCLGAPVTFSDMSSAANSTVTQWMWNFGDGSTSTLQNPSKNYATAGSYNVTLTVTSAATCVSTVATKTVIVNPLPVANFNTSSPACEKNDLTFTDASSANAGNLVKWTWDYGDGSTAVLNNPAAFLHRYSSAGTYNVKLQVETDKGCVSTMLTKPVVINTLPKAGFVSPEICLTDPAAPFMDTSKVSVGTVVAWQWNFGDPNANAGNPNTSALQNPTHRYLLTGSYTAALIVTSDKGCVDSVSQSFTVNGSVPLADFTVLNAGTLCSNNDVVISNTSTVDFGQLVRVEIYWDYTNDPTIQTIDLSPGAGKDYSHKYPEFGSPVTKTYSVRMVSYSGINCLNEITKTITVLATPTIRFDPIPETCSNNPSFQITQAGITNILPGTGVFTGTGISSTGLFDPNAAGAGTHTIRFTYTGANSCSNMMDQTILVNETPVADAGSDKTVLEGGQVQLTPAQNANFPVNYLWTPADFLSSTTVPDPLASPTDDITYTLTVTSEKGCNTSDDVFVKVLKSPQIPNVFSPNGDGVHDTWIIPFLETYPYATVEIFNRYGQSIFYSVGYTKPWDGTIKGKPVPVGTYYYIVDPKFGRKKQSGYVDVIR